MGLPPAAWEAYQFDLVVRNVGVAWENEQMEKAKEDRPGAFSGNKNAPPPPSNASWASLKGHKGVTFK